MCRTKTPLFRTALLAFGIGFLGLAGPQGLVGEAHAREIRVSDRVFLVRDRAGTPTEFQMIVNAGCADEANGDCRGLAHYLEHLVLVGRNPENKDVAARFFPEATSNGWTNQKATVYTHRIPARETGPKADLEKLFAFYAARLDTFSIPPDEAIRERNVVMQEHDWRASSNPFQPFIRKIDRLLLPDHPLGQWPIGTPESIRSLTLDQAHAFHQTWYHPNNVWFVVKGDITPEALKALSDTALAKVARKPLPERLSRRAPAVPNERHDITDSGDRIQRANVIYKKVVRIEEKDALGEDAARLMLTSFIGSQLPGSLHDALIERAKLATGTTYFSLTRITPGTYSLSISAEVATGAAPGALLRAIEDFANGLATFDVPDKAIERLKRRFADQRKSTEISPQQVYGRLISWLAAPQNFEDLGPFQDRLQTLEKPELAALLGKIAAPGRVVTGIITPKEGSVAP